MSNVECRMPSMIWKHLEPWYSAKFWKNPLQSIRKMMNLTRKRRKFAKIPIQLTVELFDADCAWSCCVPISLSTTGTIRGGLSDVLRCPSFVFCVPVLWFTVPIPEPSSAFSEPSLPCPARSAGVLNPLTRTIVFVRASVRPCLPHFRIVSWQLFVRNVLFENLV